MLQDTDVYVRKTGTTGYPDKPPYNPDKYYPEYPFEFDINSFDEQEYKNPVYDNVRMLLYDMGLDKENFGLACWNPFGEYIKPGDTVLLKPNLVLHQNHIRHYGLDCVITDGSVIRAVTDYVYIALKGFGKIIIADAPVQACDFDETIRHAGLPEIHKLYLEHGFNIKILDFRQEQALLGKNGRIAGIKKLPGDPGGYRRVDLKKESMHDEVSALFERFRVTNYDPDRMKEHHNREVHEYLIASSVLEADVVINLAKPKTHRKAGLTGAMKNLVGINGSKDWLPHHKAGSSSENGDEYLHKDLLKKFHTFLQERMDICSINGRNKTAACLRLLQLLNGIFRKNLAKDDYREGSWWGNDTVWRTICDLNRLLIYADKKGELQKTAQRVCISILDMIISGEGEGPLSPTPKDAGILMAGINPVVVDTVLAGIMGFDYKKIPHIVKSYDIETYPLYNKRAEEIKIYSNHKDWNGGLDCLRFSNSLKYNACAGWKGHIELAE